MTKTKNKIENKIKEILEDFIFNVNYKGDPDGWSWADTIDELSALFDLKWKKRIGGMLEETNRKSGFTDKKVKEDDNLFRAGKKQALKSLIKAGL